MHDGSRGSGRLSESCPGHPNGDKAECLKDSGQRHRVWTQRTGDQISAPPLWLCVLECEPQFLHLQSGLMTLTLHCSPEKQTKHFKCLVPLTMTRLPREGPGVEKGKKERGQKESSSTLWCHRWRNQGPAKETVSSGHLLLWVGPDLLGSCPSISIRNDCILGSSSSPDNHRHQVPSPPPPTPTPSLQQRKLSSNRGSWPVGLSL